MRYLEVTGLLGICRWALIVVKEWKLAKTECDRSSLDDVCEYAQSNAQSRGRVLHTPIPDNCLPKVMGREVPI